MRIRYLTNIELRISKTGSSVLPEVRNTLGSFTGLGSVKWKK